MVKNLKSMVLVLAGLVFFALGQPVRAQEVEQKEIITPQAYKYLADCSCYNTLSETTVGVSGKTQTYSSVDKITTTIYLEKKTSSGWSTVKSWTNSSSNSSYCNVSGSIIVPSGYTYRVRCYHRADKGNLVETTTSYTSTFSVK